MGKLFEPEEKCLIALNLENLEQILLRIKDRQKSPNTIATKIKEKFGVKSTQEIFLLDPKTGQVRVTLERGRKNLNNLEFVYPEDYYAKKNQDYAHRQEKRKIAAFNKKN